MIPSSFQLHHENILVKVTVSFAFPNLRVNSQPPCHLTAEQLRQADPHLCLQTSFLGFWDDTVFWFSFCSISWPFFISVRFSSFPWPLSDCVALDSGHRPRLISSCPVVLVAICMLIASYFIFVDLTSSLNSRPVYPTVTSASPAEWLMSISHSAKIIKCYACTGKSQTGFRWIHPHGLSTLLLARTNLKHHSIICPSSQFKAHRVIFYSFLSYSWPSHW